MAADKIEPDGRFVNQETLGEVDQGMTPLAAEVARHFAKRRPAKSSALRLTRKAPGAKEQGALIALWHCYHLNDIMVKCIIYGKKRGLNGK